MKVIIAGGRDLFDPNPILEAIEESGFIITELVCGMASGVDENGRQWAEEKGLHIEEFPAKWDDLSHRDAIIKSNRYGKKYNTKAGIRRNQQMAEFAEALIAIWDGKSAGTRNMIFEAKKRGLKVFVKYVKR